jgi:hypothetical protein
VRGTPLNRFIKRLMFTADDGVDALHYTLEADTDFISAGEL